MAHEPKKRHSKASKRVRRASIALKNIGLIKCKNCGQPAVPHQVCKECGIYGDKQVKTKTAVKVTKA